MQTMYKERDNQAYSINEVFTRKIEDHWLLTTRHGGWVLLNNQEFKKFKNREFENNENFFRKLEDSGIIITSQNRKNILSDLRKKHSRLVRPATYHVIPISESCNLNCKYCHPDAKPGKGLMDRDAAEEILDFIFSIPNLENKSMKIVLTGGEPLLNYDVLRYTLSEANKRSKERKIRLNISFVSNFTLMDDDIAKELTKTNLQFCTSLDGPKELHNKQRPYQSGKGSYEEVVYWIKRLREEYNTRTGAIPVVTKLSLKYGPKKFVDSYLEVGQREVFFKPYRPQGRAKENDELRMTPEEFFSFYKEGLEYCIKLYKKGVKVRERTTKEIMDNFLSSRRACMCRDRPCGAGLTMLSYNKDGKVMACDSLRSIEEFELGTVKDDYTTIRANALPIVSNTSDVIPACSSCAYNAYCGTCPGVAYGDYDDVFPKPPIDFECNWQKMVMDLLMKKIIKGEGEIFKEWVRNYYSNKPRSSCKRKKEKIK